MKHLAVLLLLTLTPLTLADNKPDARLAAGATVYVEKAEKDADSYMLKELDKWNRWKIVADESQATLLIRLRASGSGAWGVGRVQAFILDAKTKETLWTSKSQKGMRTVFSGYASPFARAVSGIIKQMKKEIQ